MLIPDAVVPAGFDGPVRTATWLPGEWVVLDAVTYTALDGRVFVVPPGFITDFASIPRIAQALYAVDDETRLPAVLHDWLYCSQEVSRREADMLFRECLARANVRWTKRQAFYAAVVSGGWVYWDDHGPELNDDDVVSLQQLAFLRTPCPLPCGRT